ncbi:hypothetical protein [Micromonospora sp. CB01531]|uniref:hypothetical protein n=1 Tax=Micromonospora sp. CB01531 TaxID=1718947 RepID=UPI00096344D1|nr:hypothetical protein [Micromonospora sp. CB01531]OKI52877.1 hypothetical protein A6A27_08290 [Micromonospora sp. CB01531]
MSRGFAALPPAQRQLSAAIGSLTRWSRVNSQEERTAALAPAREARRRQWERQADPDGVLSPDELAAAVDRLKRAHYRRMALESAKKRRRDAA